MPKLKLMLASLLAVAAVGCVTINVYFPAAAAEQAAQQFIGNVIGPADSVPAPASSSELPVDADADDGGLGMLLLNLVVPAAHAAAPDLKVSTPKIEKLRASMRARYQASLKSMLDAGIVGYTNDGLVAVRPGAEVPLAKRNHVRQVVAAANSDRSAVYHLIAVANGHPEWESKIRKTFARQWREMAHPGWYYQDAAGNWQQK